MRVTLLLTLLFLCFETGTAQIICDRLLKDGKAAFNTGNWSRAREFYLQGLKNSMCKDINWQALIKECDDKIRSAQTKQQQIITISPPQPSPCDILMQTGREKFDSNNYEEAKTLFITASEQGCSAAGDLIKKCDEKIREIQCNNDINTGIDYYNNRIYEKALPYFEKAAKNGCPDAEDYIQKSKAHIAEIAASLDLAGIRRMILSNVASNTTQSFPGGAYKGEVLNMQRNGIGIYIWSTGAIYIGEFLNGFRSGNGIYIVQDGHTMNPFDNCLLYIGAYENDNKRNGSCYDDIGKLIYSGKFSADMPTDNYPSTNNDSSSKFEILKNANGYTYCGETKYGKSNGLGIEIDNNGNIKFGNWKDGQLYGSCIHFYKNGGVEKLNL